MGVMCSIERSRHDRECNRDFISLTTICVRGQAKQSKYACLGIIGTYSRPFWRGTVRLTLGLSAYQSIEWKVDFPNWWYLCMRWPHLYRNMDRILDSDRHQGIHMWTFESHMRSKFQQGNLMNSWKWEQANPFKYGKYATNTVSAVYYQSHSDSVVKNFVCNILSYTYIARIQYRHMFEWIIRATGGIIVTF